MVFLNLKVKDSEISLKYFEKQILMPIESWIQLLCEMFSLLYET